MSKIIENFEAMLARGQDSAMLRFTLGNAYFSAERTAEAIEHLTEAVRLDPEYSAAWKLLGKALTKAGERDRARESYEKGIAVAESRGDLQAAREMRVFLKRLL